jgi:hypothetical protein
MGWFDRIVDWGAEVIGYEDIDDIDFGFTAGEQLISDVKDFTSMDSVGFIKKGVEAYGKMAGLGQKGAAQKPFRPTQMRQTRSYKGMFPGSSTPQYQASQVNMAVGANNPNIQTALAALMNASYNTQMNNVVSQFTVTPTIGQGRKTAVGTTSLSRTQRTRTA